MKLTAGARGTSTVPSPGSSRLAQTPSLVTPWVSRGMSTRTTAIPDVSCFAGHPTSPPLDGRSLAVDDEQLAVSRWPFEQLLRGEPLNGGGCGQIEARIIAGEEAVVGLGCDLRCKGGLPRSWRPDNPEDRGEACRGIIDGCPVGVATVG